MFEKNEVTILQCFLPYLVNGDIDCITYKEKECIDEFIQSITKGRTFHISYDDLQHQFGFCECMNILGDVVEVYIMINKNKKGTE